MGCDIHMFAEIESKKVKDEFTSVGELIILRHYRLFSQLAGVRSNTGDEGFEPKGMPPKYGWEVNWQSSEDEWGLDMHTPSYLTYKELELAEPKVYDYKKDDWYLMLKGLTEKHAKSRIRVVFWFDN